MNDVGTVLAFAFGAFMGALIMGVFMGTVAHQQFEKYRTMKAIAFTMEEQLLDCLDGNVEKKWMLMAEGADDPTVQRVTESQQKATSRVSEVPEGTHIIKIGDMDDA